MILTIRRPILGILGGICAGKSHVSGRIAALGPGRVVNADALAHEALDAVAADGRLDTALGTGFVRKDDSGRARADRQALADHVFGDAPSLRRLERLIHPIVHVAVRAAIDEHRMGEGPAVLVLDIPLLIEVGLDRACNALWFVDVPDDVRAARATQRGLTMEQIAQRERFQSPLARKRARADRIIDNTVSPTELDAQIREALAALGVTATTGAAPASAT